MNQLLINPLTIFKIYNSHTLSSDQHILSSIFRVFAIISLIRTKIFWIFCTKKSKNILKRADEERVNDKTFPRVHTLFNLILGPSNRSLFPLFCISHVPREWSMNKYHSLKWTNFNQKAENFNQKKEIERGHLILRRTCWKSAQSHKSRLS